MPVYEYLCKECNSRFDTLMRLSSASTQVACSSCSSPNVRRLMSSFATVGGYDDEFVASSANVGGGGGCCGGGCGCGH